MTNSKNAIIQAAIGRMCIQGKSFSTEDVAADAGCSQSLIFRYFGTKEGLIGACFDEICHQLRLELEKVPVPDDVRDDDILEYIMGVWGTYFNYLRSNKSNARVYVTCVSLGYRFPAGCSSPKDVMKRILNRHYGQLMQGRPDFSFVAEYLILVANAVALGFSSGWDGADEGLEDRLRNMIVNGLKSQL